MTANDRDAARGATESDVHAPGVLGDVPPVSGARLARYAEAIEGAVAFLTRLADYAETDDLRGQALGHAEELRGVDAEQAELKAEVERWVEKANEAGKAYADANTKHHEELDRANRLEGMCERLAEQAVEYQDAQRAAEAALVSEREAHAGLRARLNALADAWERDAAEPGGHSLLVQAYRGLARNLRATLAAPVAAEEGGEQEAGEGTHQRPGCTCGGISACLVCQEADEQEVGEAKVTWHRLVEVISSTLGCDIQAWQDRVTGEWDANCETCGANADEDGCLNAQRLATAVDRLLHTAPSGSDEQGDRPATPDANGVHDTKGGDGR